MIKMRQVSPTLAPVRPSLLSVASVSVAARRVAVIAVRPSARASASVLPLGLAPSRKLQHATLLAPLPPSLPRASLSCRRTHFLRLSLAAAAAIRVLPIMREEDRCPHERRFEGVIGVEGAKDGRRRRRGGDFKHASTEVPLVDDCHCISGLKKGEAERRGPKLRRHARDFTPPKALPVTLYLTLQFRCWCSGLAHTRPVVLHPYHNIHV